MIFHTANSTYELDQNNNRIRRLTGKRDPSPRQSKDGEWRQFEFCSEVVKDRGVLIHWGDEKCTMTSVVVSVDPPMN